MLSWYSFYLTPVYYSAPFYLLFSVALFVPFLLAFLFLVSFLFFYLSPFFKYFNCSSLRTLFSLNIFTIFFRSLSVLLVRTCDCSRVKPLIGFQKVCRFLWIPRCLEEISLFPQCYFIITVKDVWFCYGGATNWFSKTLSASVNSHSFGRDRIYGLIIKRVINKK